MQKICLNKFIFVYVSFFIISCGNNKQSEQKVLPPPMVNVYVLTKEAAVYYNQYPATVNALNAVDLKAQVTGYITNIYFKDGQHITKGQKLYDIDRQQYQANYEQAIANVNVAKANLDKVQKDADRYNDLLKQDAIAKQIVDHAMADLQSAKMQLAAAKANAARIETDLKYSVIYAPFDGTIGISQVKLGALVTANQTLLNTISSDNPMAVDVAIDQNQIPRFVLWQQKPPPSTDSIFTLKMPDNSIYTKMGSIALIDRAIDPQTGTIKVRFVFANENNLLKAGMNCEIRIKNNQATDKFLMIPNKALVEQMGEFFAYVVNDSSRAIQHKLQLGARVNDKVIVKEGLNEGDKIIIDGVQKLRDSIKVTVTSPKTK
ncbi:MAG: efflux RND transporter periplasmic adaptor subunit [Bacteroidetes bacterium]|nr:efflux RND transporter periplasmic adaptor subunit [Bacteroidota bacterium]MBS1649502.1 efflux RND transporter periplasmic adaptor subunit [Bacteroidota bacterium]